MAPLQRMDAYLDIFSTELYQVNVRIGRIAWQHASMGGFAPKATPSPPSPVASESEDDGDDDDSSDDVNRDVSSTDEMSTWHSTFVTRDKKGGVVLDMRVITLRGRVSFWIIVLGGVLFLF